VSAYDVTFDLQEKLINAENFMFRVRPRAEQNTEERYGEWSQKSSRFKAVSECGQSEYLNDTTGPFHKNDGSFDEVEWNKTCGHVDMNKFDQEYLGTRFFSAGARAILKKGIYKNRQMCPEKDPREWKCAACPPGGSCVSPDVESINIKALFGWSRCSQSNATSANRIFERCPFAAACLGAPNLALSDKFEGDLATQDREEGCNEAYRNVSDNFLCFGCAPGYSHTGGDTSGRCGKDSDDLVL